ncbi:MAG: hypothetical protein KGI11_08215 [Thaumarchaeota archaeon]|nr:hypothetical protein [Nitrososphaerota archaeon]
MGSNSVIVLGICDGHNSGACLLKDGSIVAAISEERLSRIKNDTGYPYKSVRKVLEMTQIHPEDIEIVALAGKYGHRKEFYANFDWYRTGYKEQLADFANRSKNEQDAASLLGERKDRIAKDLAIPDKKIVVVEHHLCHAATAYYASNWVNNEKVVVLTCDGSGDGICATVNIGEGGKLTRLSQTPSKSSVGRIYSRVTYLMGMKPWEHEYKIMGLAPYADEGGVQKSYGILSTLVEVRDGNLEFNMKSNLEAGYCYQFLREKLENHRFDWMAGAVQKFTEDLLIMWVRNIIKHTGIRKLACAGGVFMNVKANMMIREMDEVEDLFVFPSCGDESISIGAAYSAYSDYLAQHGEGFPKKPIGPIYYGPSYSNEEIEEYLKKNLGRQFTIEYREDINDHIAELLTHGKIIARFNDKMEFGARALGNRSILADPSNYDQVRELNMAIKQRDFWMPFAPSILIENQEELIENPEKIRSPYMMQGFRTKDSAHKNLASAIHPYDFTARPQILEKNYNLSYHQLISSFFKLTGIPGVLNTSFNLHGEPIVCSPLDAIQTLKNSGLKHLAIGNYFVIKK